MREEIWSTTARGCCIPAAANDAQRIFGDRSTGVRPAVGAAVEQPSYLHSLLLDRHVSRVTSSDAMGFLPEKDARAPQPGDEISYDSRCYVLCVPGRPRMKQQFKFLLMACLLVPDTADPAAQLPLNSCRRLESSPAHCSRRPNMM